MAKACCSTNCRTIRGTPDWRIGQSPSYLARFKNDAALELDMGHTDEDMIFAHYSQLVKPKDAERHRNITPAITEKIVPFVTRV
jgi:hypothetical protein